jgi:hypothetical protein
MRIVVILLLLANLSLFAYTRLDAMPEGEGVRLAEQVQPEKIKLLTPKQVAQLGPAKVAALADVCLEWGPLGDADRARALADLEPLGLGKLLAQRRFETSTAFWVYLPAAPNRAEAERRAGELKARGIGDAVVVDNGPQRLTVSLGAFRDEEAAKVRLAELAAQGVANAKVGPRQQVFAQTVLVIRDPPASVVGKVRELLPAYPGTDTKAGACDKG